MDASEALFQNDQKYNAVITRVCNSTKIFHNSRLIRRFFRSLIWPNISILGKQINREFFFIAQPKKKLKSISICAFLPQRFVYHSLLNLSFFISTSRSKMVHLMGVLSISSRYDFLFSQKSSPQKQKKKVKYFSYSVAFVPEGHIKSGAVDPSWKESMSLKL